MAAMYSHFRLSAALALLCGYCACASDVPSAKPKPLGPEVDITLKDATTRRGLLLSFTNGVITMELDSGDRLVKQSGEVTSLRFIGTREIPTAQATQLTLDESSKIRDLSLRLATLNKDEVRTLDLLRTKLNIHIEALKREIPDVKTESAAAEYLKDLGHSLEGCGRSMMDMRGEMVQAVNSIKDARIVAALKSLPKHQFIQRFLEGPKPKNPDKRPYFGPPPALPPRPGDKQ